MSNKADNITTESSLISCLMLSERGQDTLDKCREAQLNEQTFTQQNHAELYRLIAGLHDNGIHEGIGDELMRTNHEHINVLLELTGDKSVDISTHVRKYIKDLKEAEFARRVLVANAQFSEDLSKPNANQAEALEKHLAALESIKPKTENPLLVRILEAEQNLLTPPIPDSPVFYVAGKLTNTTSNLGAITSPAKVGKTAVIGAHAAACLVADGIGLPNSDTLGIRSEPLNGKAVIIIDTEQSKAYACKLLNGVRKRVGIEQQDLPAWLRLYSCASWSAGELVKSLPVLMEHVAKLHGGIHAVLIDGGADFSVNVNDPEEAASLVSSWHSLAQLHTCTIIVVVHSNEGEKADSTARGWLGKQLRRKAESNLQLKRSGEVVTLFGESGQRHAPIYEREGPNFAFDEKAGMFKSVSESPKVSRKKADLQILAAAVYASNATMTWSALRNSIKSLQGCSNSTAEKRINDLKSANCIKSDRNGLMERILQNITPNPDSTPIAAN